MPDAALASQRLLNSSWLLCAAGTPCTDLWEQQTGSCWRGHVPEGTCSFSSVSGDSHSVTTLWCVCGAAKAQLQAQGWALSTSEPQT